MENDSSSIAPTVEESSHNHHHPHEHEIHQSVDAKGIDNQPSVEKNEESSAVSHQSHLVNGETVLEPEKSTDLSHVPFQGDVENPSETAEHVQHSSQEAVDERLPVQSISKEDHIDTELPTITIPVVSDDHDEAPIQQTDGSLQNTPLVDVNTGPKSEETTSETPKELIDIPVTEELEEAHNEYSPAAEDTEKSAPESTVELHDIHVTLDTEESHDEKEVESEVSPVHAATEESALTKPAEGELFDIPVALDTEETHDKTEVENEVNPVQNAGEVIEVSKPIEGELFDIPVSLDTEETREKAPVENEGSPVQVADELPELSKPVEEELFDIPVVLDTEETHDKAEIEGEVSPVQATEVSEVPKTTEGELLDIPVSLEPVESETLKEVTELTENAREPDHEPLAEVAEDTHQAEHDGLIDIPVTKDDSEEGHEEVLPEQGDVAVSQVVEQSIPESSLTEDVKLHDIPVTLDTEELHEKADEEVDLSTVQTTDELVDSSNSTEELFDIPVTKDDFEETHEDALPEQGDSAVSQVVEESIPESSVTEDVKLHDIPVTLDTEELHEKADDVSTVQTTDELVDSSKSTEELFDIPVSLETPDLEVKIDSQPVEQTPVALTESPAFQEDVPQQPEELKVSEEAVDNVEAPTTEHVEESKELLSSDLIDIAVIRDVDDAEPCTDKQEDEIEQTHLTEVHDAPSEETESENVTASVNEVLHTIPVTQDLEELEKPQDTTPVEQVDHSVPPVDSSVPQETSGITDETKESVPEETHELATSAEIEETPVEESVPVHAEIIDETNKPITDVQSAAVPLITEPEVAEKEELVDIPVELVDEPESQKVIEVESLPAAQETIPADVNQLLPSLPVKEEEPESRVASDVPETQETSTELVSEEQTPQVNVDDSIVEEEVMEAPKQVSAVHATPPTAVESAQEPESELSVSSVPPESEEAGIDIPVEIIDKPEEEQQLLLNVNPESKLLSASGDRINVIGHNHQIQRPPSPELIDIPIEVEDAVTPTQTASVQSAPLPHEGEQNGDAAEAKHPTEEKGRAKIGSKSPNSPEPEKKKKHGGFRKLFSCVRGHKD